MDMGLIFFMTALVLGLILGAAVGYFMSGRSGGGKGGAELRAKAQAHDELKGQIGEHMRESARLMDQLSDDYRQMYQHLAIGAQRLADETLAPPEQLSAIAHDDDAQPDDLGKPEPEVEPEQDLITDMPPPDVPRRDD